MRIQIIIDDLSGPEIDGLLTEHHQYIVAVSPPESRHALNLEELRRPDITLWSAWNGTELAGCGALQELDTRHAEIKSMRTAKSYFRKGVASQLLRHILEKAKERGYQQLSLETGSMGYFEPARALYTKFGFRHCGPFAGYIEDPNSVFMTRELK